MTENWLTSRIRRLNKAKQICGQDHVSLSENCMNFCWNFSLFRLNTRNYGKEKTIYLKSFHALHIIEISPLPKSFQNKQRVNFSHCNCQWDNDCYRWTLGCQKRLRSNIMFWGPPLSNVLLLTKYLHSLSVFSCLIAKTLNIIIYKPLY